MFSEISLQFDEINKNIKFINESIHIDIPSGERQFSALRTKHCNNRVYQDMPLQCLENEARILKNSSTNQKEISKTQNIDAHTKDCNYKYIKNISKVSKECVKINSNPIDKV